MGIALMVLASVTAAALVDSHYRSGPCASGAPNLNAFTISSGFQSGMNTLDFVVDEPDNFDGLRVRDLNLNVTPILVGDYNQNGAVDSADYVEWRANQGTTNVLPNDPLGGTIGNAQYNQWRSHFSQTAGSGLSASTNTVVPEPATFALLMFAAGVACRLRRHGA